MFTFFDPGDAVEMLGLNADPGEFRLQAYMFMILLIWLVLWISVIINCFYRSVRGDCVPNNENDENIDSR